MKDIFTSMILLTLITTIARLILPRIEVFVKWIIKKSVHFAEKRVKGCSMGEVKKRKVLKWLKIFGIKSNDIVETFIDSAVYIMNNKRGDIISNTQNEVADKVVNKLEDTTKQIIK